MIVTQELTYEDVIRAAIRKTLKSAWNSPDDPPEDGELVIVCAKDDFIDEVVIDTAWFSVITGKFIGTKFRVWHVDDKNLYGWAPLPPKIRRRVKA